MSVSDSSIIDHTLHPNSHPSSICVLSTHLLRCRKIGQAACRNVSQVSVSHADCSDRPLYELLSTAPMPRIQSRWPFLHISQLKIRRNRVAGALPRPAQCSSPPMTLGCLSIQPERSRFFAQSGIEVRGFTPASAVCLLLAVIMVWMPLKQPRGGCHGGGSRATAGRERSELSSAAH